ncbi:MAG: DMT family transporter [Promethearchaeota archaeon]
MNRIRAYSYAIISMVLWGFTFPLSIKVIPKPLNILTYSAIRSFFGVLVLFSYIVITHQLKEWFLVFKRNFSYFILIGVIFYVTPFLLQFWSLGFTTPINQSILSNTQTFWVVIFNLIFFKQKPKFRFLIGLFLTIFGVLILLVDDHLSFSSSTLSGDIFSLISFVLWAGYTAFIKPLSMKEKSIHITFSIILIGALIFIPLSFFTDISHKINQLNLGQWLTLFYLGFVCIGITYLLWNSALVNKEVRSENIVLLTLLSPVVAVFSSIILVDGVLTIKILIGFLIIAVGFIIAEYPSKKILFNSKNIR